MTNGRKGPGGESPDSRVGTVLRFGTELVAWVGAPWALASYSVPLAVVSVVVLIGLPTVFTTPGDKAHGLVPSPGIVPVLLDLLHIAVAVISAWIAWLTGAAVAVTMLAAAAFVSQLPRWRWLVRRGSSSAGQSEVVP